MYVDDDTERGDSPVLVIDMGLIETREDVQSLWDIGSCQVRDEGPLSAASGVHVRANAICRCLQNALVSKGRDTAILRAACLYRRRSPGTRLLASVILSALYGLTAAISIAEAIAHPCIERHPVFLYDTTCP